MVTPSSAHDDPVIIIEKLRDDETHIRASADEVEQAVAALGEEADTVRIPAGETAREVLRGQVQTMRAWADDLRDKRIKLERGIQ